MLTNEQITTVVERVCKWNENAGNKPWVIDYKLEDNLFNEEYNEFLEAQKNWDKIEGLDGVIDMIIVYIWTLYKDNNSIDYIETRISQAFAMSPLTKENKIRECLEVIKPFVKDFYWAFIHILDSNDSKFIDWKAIKNEAWKIMKWPNYFKPDLKPFIK